MTASPNEQNANIGKPEKDVDKSLEDTFPASDAATSSGTTRIESEDGEEDADEDSPK